MNFLSDFKKEYFYSLISECSEIQRLTCKILSCGYGVENNSKSNKKLLEEQLLQLQYTIECILDQMYKKKYIETVKERYHIETGKKFLTEQEYYQQSDNSRNNYMLSEYYNNPDKFI